MDSQAVHIEDVHGGEPVYSTIDDFNTALFDDREVTPSEFRHEFLDGEDELFIEYWENRNNPYPKVFDSVVGRDKHGQKTLYTKNVDSGDTQDEEPEGWLDRKMYRAEEKLDNNVAEPLREWGASKADRSDSDDELEELANTSSGYRYLAEAAAIAGAVGGASYLATNDPVEASGLFFGVFMLKTSLDLSVREPYKEGARSAAQNEQYRRRADEVQKEMEEENYQVVPLEEQEFRTVRRILNNDLDVFSGGEQLDIQLAEGENSGPGIEFG